MGLKLFEGSDSENEDVSRIQIDREFARKYEHNKKREDLHRLQELKKKRLVQSSSGSQSGSSSSSSDEEDDGFVISGKKDNEFFEALIKVKKQDPIIKNKDVKLFESDEEEEEAKEDGKDLKSKKKAMYLKDVMAKHLIEDGPEFEDEEGGEWKMEEEEKKKSYREEQEDIRRPVLEAAVLEDGGEDLFKIKEKNEEEVEEKGENGEFVRKLDEYFGGDGEVNGGNGFLKNFFGERMWVDREMEGREIGEEELECVSEDEREIERQEEYEYRFQENAGDRVMGHARKVEGSVRKKVNSRKEQRKSKEERMEAARIEREEELKHLKNLKKGEMDKKVRKILRTAGIREDEVVPLTGKELDEEFDPEEYDRMMMAAFGEEYYKEEDADPEFGNNREEDEGEIEKPDFDEEDELLGLPNGWGECGPDDGFLAARERSLKRNVGNEGESDQEEEDTEKGKRKRKRKKSAILEKAKVAMMEEYYKLDYEDTIGDLKTRFKYANTKPNRYGLSAEELLVMDEKELNQYVSLKKLAPYREKEWKLSDKKRYQLKMRTKELLRGGKFEEQKGGKKKRSSDNAEKSISQGSAAEDGKSQVQESNGYLSSLTRQAKRRRRQAEVKLSHSRLMAYGKIPSKSKRKAKH